jgi:hypothetical protein
MNFGAQLLEQKDSSGWLTTLDLPSPFKKLAQESSTNWINLGGVRFQRSFGDKLKNRN